jgi:predicted O-methyltransferase YrrM
MTVTLPWRLPGFGPRIQTSITFSEANELQALAVGKQVLEIGSAYGYSTVLMATVAEHVVSVDPHKAHDSAEIFISNLESYKVRRRVTPYMGYSRDVLLLLQGEQFDLVFVDGEHTANGVAHDLNQALRLVKPHGRLAFHDWDESTCPDVRPTLERWRQPDYIVDTLAVYRA